MERRRSISPEEIETMQLELKRFTEDCHFYRDHRSDLLEQYPNSYIAIFNKEVVAHALNPNELMEQLKERDANTDEKVMGRVLIKDFIPENRVRIPSFWIKK